MFVCMHASPKYLVTKVPYVLPRRYINEKVKGDSIIKYSLFFYFCFGWGIVCRMLMVGSRSWGTVWTQQPSVVLVEGPMMLLTCSTWQRVFTPFALQSKSLFSISIWLHSFNIMDIHMLNLTRYFMLGQNISTSSFGVVVINAKVPSIFHGFVALRNLWPILSLDNNKIWVLWLWIPHFNIKLQYLLYEDLIYNILICSLINKPNYLLRSHLI